MKRILAGLAAILALLLATCANAQGPWPNKPIKLVAVFPPGGSVDQVARILGQQLTSQVGQPAELDKFLRGEITRWAKVVKDNKIKAGD